MTGKTFTSFRTNKKKERPFDLIKIGLTASREILYDRINRRVDAMVGAGLEEEARRLFEFRENNALNTVGYREWFEHFEGKTSREEAIEKIKSNTRRYARKQQTWFKRDSDIRWFDIAEIDQIIPYIHQMKNQ
jgi:tRNA dimethylallyltransferase